MTRRLTLVLVALALLVPAAVAQADTSSLWTPVNSGTADTISAIVYQSPTRFWYATTNGHIEYFNGSAFVAGSGVTPGEDFTGLAFQSVAVPGNPGTAGLYGYAVTNNGHVWQTSNGGVSWTMLASPATRSDCGDTATVTTVSELNAVAWGGSSSVYLLGDDSTLEKAADANTPAPTFAEINKVGTGTCLAQSDTSSQNLTDATFLPGNVADGLIVTQDFGTLYSTSNAWASGIRLTNDTVNNFQGSPRVAQDPRNPNNVFVVDHQPGGGGCGTLCLIVSNDGGSTSGAAKFPNDATPGGRPLWHQLPGRRRGRGRDRRRDLQLRQRHRLLPQPRPRDAADGQLARRGRLRLGPRRRRRGGRGARHQHRGEPHLAAEGASVGHRARHRERRRRHAHVLPHGDRDRAQRPLRPDPRLGAASRGSSSPRSSRSRARRRSAPAG